MSNSREELNKIQTSIHTGVGGVHLKLSVNPLASPSAGAPELKYGDVNTVTPSLGKVKGLTKTNTLVTPRPNS